MFSGKFKQTISPQHETGLWEHLTKSMPNSHPNKEASAEATVRLCMLNVYLYSMFMVMLTLYKSVLTSSASACPRLMVTGHADRISWEGELRTAATLIPAPFRGSLLPVELSERRLL
jgi:hypothetical protein